MSHVSQVASILLKEGASPSSETLFLAAAVSDAALVDEIIRKHPGVDLWHMDDDYGTALHMAAALGNAEVCTGCSVGMPVIVPVHGVRVHNRL